MRLARKGMSPLIATVLLMAFAVALGGMIMNWSSGGSEEAGPATDACKEITLQSSQNCVGSGGINLRVRNTGTENIGQLGMVVETGEANPTVIPIPDSKLAKGESKSLRVTLPLPVGSRVSLYPYLGDGSNLAKCPTPALSLVLDPCT